MKTYKFLSILFVCVLAIDIVSQYLIASLIMYLKPPGIEHISCHTGGYHEAQPSVYVFALAALVEEGMFRYLPYTILCKIGKDKNKWFVIITGIITSLVFGFIHGNYLNIFLQGIGGGLYFTTFVIAARHIEIKDGGPYEYFWDEPLFTYRDKALLFMALLHFTFNMVVGLL